MTWSQIFYGLLFHIHLMLCNEPRDKNENFLKSSFFLLSLSVLYCKLCWRLVLNQHFYVTVKIFKHEKGWKNCLQHHSHPQFFKSHAAVRFTTGWAFLFWSKFFFIIASEILSVLLCWIYRVWSLTIHGHNLSALYSQK